jgi:hypothetical protein
MINNDRGMMPLELWTRETPQEAPWAALHSLEEFACFEHKKSSQEHNNIKQGGTGSLLAMVSEGLPPY